MMKNEHEYILKDAMSHSDIPGFIKPWLKKKNIYTRIFNYTQLGGLLLIGFYIGMSLSSGQFEIKTVSNFFLGIAIGFLIIPVHEWLYGIAYKLVGAKSVQYSANWKKLVFYAAADGYPTGYKEFRFVALLPFSVITLIGFAIMIGSGFEWTAVMFGFILAHAACCGGDFGLLSYMHEHKNQGIITIDDMENGETRFMVRNLRNGPF
jgi:hypothetical protein